MNYRKLLKCVEVSPDITSGLTFSNPASDTGAVRVALAGSANQITLVAAVPRPDAQPEYPTGSGYRVSFPVFNVPGVRSWLLAQFDVVLVEDPNSTPRTVTNVRARLHDGTTQYTWAAGVWSPVVSADTSWNTLAEVATHLGDWDPSKPLGLTFELSTTNRQFTPSVRGFQLMYDIDLESEFNDWLYGAVVGGLSALRPVKDILVESNGTTTLNFGTLEAGLEGWSVDGTSIFTDIVGIFNETTDRYHRTNLLSSWNSSTRIATLTSAPTSGQVLLLRVEYAPVVAVTTDQDFDSLASVPAITLDSVQIVDRGEAPEDSYIVNEYVDPPVATIFPAPRLSNIQITYTIDAPLTVDLYRLADLVKKWVNDHRLVTSPLTGDQVTSRIIEPLNATSGPDSIGLRATTGQFQLEDVYFHDRDAYTAGDAGHGGGAGYGVSNINVAVQVGSTTATTSST
jgi:hypothetical protein